MIESEDQESSIMEEGKKNTSKRDTSEGES